MPISSFQSKGRSGQLSCSEPAQCTCALSEPPASDRPSHLALGDWPAGSFPSQTSDAVLGQWFDMG